MVLNLSTYEAMIGESVHSGHFMMSSLTDESSDTDSGYQMHAGNMQTADIGLPVSRGVGRNSMKQPSNSRSRMFANSVADVIDGSLVTLLKCMTLDYRFVVSIRQWQIVYSMVLQVKKVRVSHADSQ